MDEWRDEREACCGGQGVMSPGAAPIASHQASHGGGRDAVSPIEPGASKAQVRKVTCGPMSRLCVGQ